MSRAEWLQAVEQTLVRGLGADAPGFDELFRRRLVHRTEDGIEVQPLYAADDEHPDPGLPGFAPYVRGSTAAGAAPDGWEARQRVWAAVDRSSAAYELEHGATGVLLDVTGDEAAGAGGSAGLATLLDGVFLELAPVSLLAGASWEPAARAMLELWDERGTDPAARLGSLGCDPVGELARSGGAGDVDAALAAAADVAAEAARRAPGAAAVVVDGTVFHEAGATEAQELAWSTATGATYVRVLVEQGLTVDQALSTIEFRLAATDDQFATIAKLRAARRLWSRVAELAGASGAGHGQRQHAVTSTAMLTRYDPWVNVLRSTVACFAAGVGGAAAVTVVPHDVLLQPGGSRLGRRVARNTQSVLRAEAGLGRVLDPGGGSYYVESLTAELARVGWAGVQEAERAGGIVAALRSGLVGERLGAAVAARDRQVATRRRPLTGLSEFPDIGETPPPPLPGLDGADEAGGATAFAPLRPRRLSEAYERQRGRADRHAAETGERPTVFLATIGPPSVHTARATFAKNLFEAGGIRTVADEHADRAGDGAGALAAAFAASGATVACLCSSDTVYDELGAEVVDALRAAGATRVLLAGSGRDVPGVDEEVARGSDVLDLLTRTLDALGVAR